MKEDIDGISPAYHRVVGKPNSDFYGFVVLDRIISGKGTGGIRYTESVTAEEVARLAREMTLKFAFLRLRSGGAKAGLVARPGISQEERHELFYRFGEAIGDLIRDGKYIGGLDMGTNPDDLRAIMLGAGQPVSSDSENTEIDSNYFTALTVFITIEALLEARGRHLQDVSVSLEGLGKVGSHLIRLLGQAGTRVVGVSTLDGAIYDQDGLDVDQVLRYRDESGDPFVKSFPGCQLMRSDELFLQPADLLIPGGGADSLNSRNIDRVDARWVVSAANICATEEIEESLYQRGIEFIPGFVANSGGIFCWHLASLSGNTREVIIRDRFKARIRRLISAADRSGRSISGTARDIALRNFEAMKRVDEGKFSARFSDLTKKLMPRRLAYAVGSRLLGRDWSRHTNFIVRSYYDARYFR